MNIGQFLEALAYYQRALEIQQISAPANHPSLATSYHNVGSVYDSMSEYSQALSYCERALQMRQKSLPGNHPHVQSVRRSVQTLKLKLNRKKTVTSKRMDGLALCAHCLDLAFRSIE